MQFFRKLLKGQQCRPSRLWPTNLRVIQQLNESWYQVLNIPLSSMKIIDVNFLISYPGNRNDRWGVSNRRGSLNNFYPGMESSIICFDLVDILWRPVITEYSVNDRLMNGIGWVVFKIQHKSFKTSFYRLNSISWQDRCGNLNHKVRLNGFSSVMEWLIIYFG